jgi:hypothetical protein
MRVHLAASVAFGLAVAPALAWNDRGHMLVAMVAYQELKPEARARVNEILKHHPQYDLLKEGEPTPGPEQDLWVFMRAATWPDLVRSNRNPLHDAENHPGWHFVDFPYSPDGTEGPAPVEKWNGTHDPANLLQAADDVMNQLQAKSTADDRRAIALCWTEHLIGDIHQPLHATSMFSAQFPNGDKGGNSFAVRRGETPTSLHAYWDDVLGRGITIATLKTQVEGWMENPNLSRAKLDGDKPEVNVPAWAHESRDIAEHQVYLDGKLKGVHHSGRGDYPASTPPLPSDYERSAKELAVKRVLLAGYRLADELNAALSPAASNDPPAKKHQSRHRVSQVRR